MLGLVGNVAAGGLTDGRFEIADNLLQLIGAQLVVQFDAGPFFVFGQNALKGIVVYVHHHVGVDLEEPPVGVVSGTSVTHQRGQAINYLVIDAQVQDGVHHSGHRDFGPGAHRQQQRVGAGAETPIHDLFQAGHILLNGCPETSRKLFTVSEIFKTGLGGYDESWGNGQAQAGHLTQAAPFTAKKVTH